MGLGAGLVYGIDWLHNKVFGDPGPTAWGRQLEVELEEAIRQRTVGNQTLETMFDRMQAIHQSGEYERLHRGDQIQLTRLRSRLFTAYGELPRRLCEEAQAMQSTDPRAALERLTEARRLLEIGNLRGLGVDWREPSWSEIARRELELLRDPALAQVRYPRLVERISTDYVETMGRYTGSVWTDPFQHLLFGMRDMAQLLEGDDSDQGRSLRSALEEVQSTHREMWNIPMRDSVGLVPRDSERRLSVAVGRTLAALKRLRSLAGLGEEMPLGRIQE